MDLVEGVTVVASVVSPDGARLGFSISSDCAYCRGHFPGQPILPAVAQLDLVLHAARLLSGSDLLLAGLRGVRFRRPLLPPCEFELTVARPDASGGLRFELRLQAGLATMGTLLVQPGGWT